MSRSCAQCGGVYDYNSFTKNQWSKGVGISRCHSCVHGGGGNSVPDLCVANTTRKNQSTCATFELYDLKNPFASGAFRWVAKGKYTEGAREGELCVCKWFKKGTTFEEDFFDLDIKAVDKAAHIIQQFNCGKYVNKLVRINVPEVWTFQPGSSFSGTKVLQEPFIECWQKFNSNTGWSDDELPWPRVMQALSHFSYHVSGGQFVLCDLQGGVYSDGVVLTDPVILSRSHGYGVTDLGPEGISSFFARHRCNEFCRKEWSKPADQHAYFQAQQGTSMMRSAQHSVPTMLGRNGLSKMY